MSTKLFRITVAFIAFMLISSALVLTSVADEPIETQGVGLRTEDPGPFLHWPLSSDYQLTNITRLPDTPWTHEFLGITDCPPYPALIERGSWKWNYPGTYPGNRTVIKSGV